MKVVLFCKCEIKGAAIAGLRFHPYFTMVPRDNFFANSKANAGAGIFVGSVQSLKNNKDPRFILLLYANAIVLH